jgi:hypothetical protein
MKTHPPSQRPFCQGTAATSASKSSEPPTSVPTPLPGPAMGGKEEEARAPVPVSNPDPAGTSPRGPVPGPAPASAPAPAPATARESQDIAAVARDLHHSTSRGCQAASVATDGSATQPPAVSVATPTATAGGPASAPTPPTTSGTQGSGGPGLGVTQLSAYASSGQRPAFVVPSLNLGRVGAVGDGEGAATTARGPPAGGGFDLARLAALDPLSATYVGGVLVNEQHIREARLALASSVRGRHSVSGVVGCECRRMWFGERVGLGTLGGRCPVVRYPGHGLGG